MSADLFAEFNEPSGTPPPQQSTPFQLLPTSQTRNAPKDPFDFSQTSQFSPQSAASTPQWPSFPAQSSGMSSWASPPKPSHPPATLNEPADDDGWGDFEVAEPTVAAPIRSPPPEQPKTWQAPSYMASKAPDPIPKIVRVPTLDLMSNTLVNFDRKPEPDFPPAQSKAQSKSKSTAKATRRDSSVLFDVDDFELQGGEDDDNEDDEFGDFETVVPTHAPAPVPVQSRHSPERVSTSINSAPSLDLLSLDDTPQMASQPNIPKESAGRAPGAFSFGAVPSKRVETSTYSSTQGRQQFPDIAVKTSGTTKSNGNSKHRKASPHSPWPSFDSKSEVGKAEQYDDNWGAWDDIPNNGGKKEDTDAAKPPESWDWDATDGVQAETTTKAADTAAPPVNVPPPSVILSTFPDLLKSGSSMFKPMSGQNASVKQQILSNPKAQQFLHGYILLATTAARVIAGRKHRWHRDKILAKSMSISVAGSKGMKLTGVDKTQAAREDREAADVVIVWREQVGRLRSAVAAANTSAKASLKVPELSETLQVQTAKGAPTAPKACVICGLKREERITKVDFDVEDSFGEWWAEHWGHRACKNFWIEHEQKLRQR